MKYLLLVVLLIASTAFAQEDNLILVLKSGASTKDKADACRQLARVGTKQSVPALSLLLADEALSHWALYALEPIADSAVDAALRNALEKLKGRLLEGVITSLGVRKDPQAVEPLAKLLSDADPTVAQAAARALGNIGSAAVPALEAALSTGSSARQLAVCEGLFRCAEKMQSDAAIAVYDKVRALANLPHQIRAAALSGAIRNRGVHGLPLLVDAFRTESYVPATDALRISMDMPGAEVTKALVDELGRANDNKQILLIQTLGFRGDATVAPTLLPLAQSGSTNRRIAAIRSLAQLGNPASLPVLAALVKDPEAAVSAAALSGLTGFPGQETDAAVMALLSEPDTKIRIAVIEAAGQRRIAAAIPALLKTAADADVAVSSASFKVLGELAGPTEISTMVDAMLQTKAVGAAETALSAICTRQSDTTDCTDKLLPSLAKARGEPKLALLRILRSVGNPQALAAVRAASAEPDPAVKDTALRALCDWPTVDVLPDLAQLAKSTADSKHKILALRGQLRLIPMQNVADTQKLSQLKELLPRIERQDEQRLMLAILGSLPSADSLALVMPYLATDGLEEESSSAAVSIAEKIKASHPAEVAQAMKKIQTKNKDLADRAQQLLAQ